VVKRISLDAERATPVRLRFSGHGLVIDAGGAEDARASAAMDCPFTGDPLKIAFNH
jgi:DNA polymerase-3 subunit beta